jgi:signal transduction histidine kinase
MIRILEILLDNALRFVEEGGHIWLEASCHSKQAVICVRDDGKGISPKALPYIFERFFKEESGYASAGNGLGLAIAKEITLALKERIWVKSEAGKGSAFYFTAQMK